MAGIDLTASSTPPKRDWLYVYVLSGIVLGLVFQDEEAAQSRAGLKVMRTTSLAVWGQ